MLSNIVNVEWSLSLGYNYTVEPGLQFSKSEFWLTGNSDS